MACGPSEVPDGGETAVIESEPQTPLSADFTGATSAIAAAELRSQDWTQGAENPRVTIIEYGDFQ